MHNNITNMIIKQKPVTIKLSLILLLTGIIIGAVNSIIIAFNSYYILPLPFLFLSSFFILLQIFLLNIIRKGYSTGRLVLTILTAFGIIYSLASNVKIGTIFWIITIIDIVAIVLLYLKQSGDWFVKISNTRYR